MMNSLWMKCLSNALTGISAITSAHIEYHTPTLTSTTCLYESSFFWLLRKNQPSHLQRLPAMQRRNSFGSACDLRQKTTRLPSISLPCANMPRKTTIAQTAAAGALRKLWKSPTITIPWICGPERVQPLLCGHWLANVVTFETTCHIMARDARCCNVTHCRAL